MKQYIILKPILLLFLLIASGCTRFLDVKPDKRIVVPDKFQDLQALLDNNYILNAGSGHLLGEIACDDYSLDYSAWQSLSTPYEKNTHVWGKDIFEGRAATDWNNPSYVILLANTVLERAALAKPEFYQEADWNNLKGSALFYRAWSQFQLAQLFCQTYVEETADRDLGIPLRLDSDMNIRSVRSTVKETYNQIVNDLKEAVLLLPLTPVVKTRPSRPAANALLARVFLQMRDYPNALIYSNLSLNESGELIDYNVVDSSAAHPFKRYNAEVLFHSETYGISALNPGRHTVSEELYALYEDNDLRKSCLFSLNGDRVVFKGSYQGSNVFFTGITTAETYLVQAECLARAGKSAEAKESLNILLQKRYKLASFSSSNITEGNGLLSYILKERRKELLFRGIRWSDLKRLNLETIHAKTLERVFNSEKIKLEPNTKRYIFPLPDEVVRLTDMPQNPR